MKTPKTLDLARGAVALVCLFPSLRIAVAFLTGVLGPDPVNAIRAATGRWVMRLLVAVLAVSPAAEQYFEFN